MVDLTARRISVLLQTNHRRSLGFSPMRAIEWAEANRCLQAFRRSLPGLIDEDCVSEYHAIIDSLEQAGQTNLDAFRIDASKLAFRMLHAYSGEHTAPRVGVQYSNKKYCDWEYFCHKLDELRDFLNHLDQNTS
ncbi:MAG TPA: hypothetical protein VKS44_02815 [Candidatus Acidoferrales bacterium]|nr:hypothetical protein [Candidatus Acidoferrales bacterium]